jgi:hypothetical protein
MSVSSSCDAATTQSPGGSSTVLSRNSIRVASSSPTCGTAESAAELPEAAASQISMAARAAW